MIVAVLSYFPNAPYSMYGIGNYVLLQFLHSRTKFSISCVDLRDDAAEIYLVFSLVIRAQRSNDANV
jgi:hypothetical protein